MIKIDPNNQDQPAMVKFTSTDGREARLYFVNGELRADGALDVGARALVEKASADLKAMGWVRNPQPADGAKPIECIVCGFTCSVEDLTDLKQCPNCEAIESPIDNRENVLVSINPAQLRHLTIWATNWLEQSLRERDLPNVRHAHERLLAKIRRQVPGVPLTLVDEIKQLQDRGVDAALYDDDGNAIVPPVSKC